VSERTRVVVMGAEAADPPPGIRVIEEVVDLAFATTAEDLAGELGAAEVLFAWRPDRELLRKAWPGAAALRWIQGSWAGVDSLLFPELVESDVVLTNARGVFDEAMGEYVLGLMLMFAKDLIGVVDRQRRKEWRRRDAELLAGRHLLIVGVGGIGRAIGRLASEFGMQVRGVGRATRPGDGVFDVILGTDELDGALPWADYVVDTLPANDATEHLFGTNAFEAMNRWTRFVNVGRGSTVDQAALVGALQAGKIGAAALDVFEEEPLPEDSPLWEMPNVIVSPHMSGDYGGWREAVVELFVENLERFLTGAPLRNVVDKHLGYVPG
jgi:phosphoglycerate dehydrogenase-like enzyme